MADIFDIYLLEAVVNGILLAMGLYRVGSQWDDKEKDDEGRIKMTGFSAVLQEMGTTEPKNA